MAVAGIIAEYNPLQQKDLQLINYAKTNLRASLIVVVMCGNFTPQGIPAMISKYERSAMAVKYGADIVIELPVVSCLADPKIYAISAVSLLRSTNMVSHLLYHSDADMAQIFQVAAAAQMGTIEPIKPIPVIQNPELGNGIPPDVLKMLRFQSQFKSVIRSVDISPLLHERLISYEDFSEFSGCTKEFSDHLNEVKGMFVEFESFSKTLMGDNLTQEGANRIMMRILLGIQGTDMTALAGTRYAPYFHVIGFSSKGTALMNIIKSKNSLPFFIAPEAGYQQMDEKRKALLDRDVYAGDLYRALVTNKSGRIYEPELTRKYELKR